MRGWRGCLEVVAVLALTAACGMAEQSGGERSGDPTATYVAARDSLLQERAAQATQTAASRPTSTPAPPTATPSPTPLPSPTPSPTLSPTPQTEPVVVLREEFADLADLPVWTGGDALFSAEIVDGAYGVTISHTNGRIIDLAGLAELGDASIQVDLRFEGEVALGVFARLADRTSGWGDRGYLCGLRDNGTLWCEYIVDGQRNCLCDLDTGQVGLAGVNTLRLTTVGGTLQVTLNGVVMYMATESASDAGTWGLYAASRTGASVRGWFDNIVVTKLPPGYQLPATSGP